MPGPRNNAATEPVAQPRRPSADGYAAGRATREALIVTAQRLFADRGIDAVSLREVSSAAGCRNTAAAQYYFQNKETLLLEIFRRRSADIAARRVALLDEVATSSNPIATIARALIAPLADQISAEGFLTFLARCQSDHVRNDGVLGEDISGSFIRARELLRDQLPGLAESLFDRRFDLAIKTAVTALAGIEWRWRTRRERIDIDEAVIDLVDVISAMLLAPSSRHTFPATEGTL